MSGFPCPGKWLTTPGTGVKNTTTADNMMKYCFSLKHADFHWYIRLINEMGSVWILLIIPTYQWNGWGCQANDFIISIKWGTVYVKDCQFKSIKKAESLLTLPEVAFNILKIYFINFFLKRLNPNVAPPTMKRVELIGSGMIATSMTSTNLTNWHY